LTTTFICIRCGVLISLACPRLKSACTEKRILLVVLHLIIILLFANISGVLITNLALDTNVIRDVTGRIAQGSDEELVPECGTVNTVVEQANRHIGPLFDGATDLLDRLGISLWSLQETAITTQDLVKSVSSKVKETLGGIYNWVVRKRRVGNDEVLLGSLQSFDEREIWVIEDLVGVHGGGSNKTSLAVGKLLANQFIGFGSAEVRTDCLSELLVLILEQGDRLLK